MVLKLGPIAIDPPVVLAPMAGVTNAPFRRLCRQHGAGLYVSEMVTARALLEGNPRSLRMASFAEDEPVRSVQLYGVDPAVMRAAVRRLVDEIGVDHIDLNFGCPAAKVTKKGGGSALPLHHVLFRQVVAAAVGAAAPAGVPVTVKLRLGIDDGHPTFVAAGRAAEEEGAAAVALHARTAEQLYSGQARWDAIGELKAAVTTVPVLGNGDIWEASDALAMMATTGCDGVVIGRGCLGRPWLFRDLAAVFGARAAESGVQGEEVPPPPGLGEIVATMRTHARLLCDLLGEEGGCRDFRKHPGWYLAGFPVGGAVRKQLSSVATLAELDAILDRLDPSWPFPDEARRVKRGHTSGPRPVALPPRWFETVDDPTPPEGADVLVSGG